MNLSVQGREALLQSPAGLITQGTGTRIAPYTTLGPLTAPTFTQGISTALAQGAERFPRAAQTLRTMFPPLAGLTAGMTAAQSYLNSQSSPLSPEEEASRQELLSQIPTTGYPAAPMRPGEPPRPVMPAAAPPLVAPAAAPSVAAADKVSDVVAAPNVNVTLEKDAAYIKPQVNIADFIKEKTTKKSKIDRIRDARSEYEPLFAEILGDDKESAKINALLLLSEAGLKLASTAKPTFAMAVADAASGLPRGFAAIAAQERELGVKGKMAALQQAIGDVDAQDKYAQALKLQLLKGDYDLLKEQAKQGGGIIEDGGMGLRITKTKSGSFLGSGIDPNDSTVQSALNSRFTLRDKDSPYVENRGEAPTTVETNKDERVKLGSTLRSFDNSLRGVDDVRGLFQQLYSPGTFFVDKVNNLFVPIDPTGLLKPNLDQEDAKIRMKTMLNTLTKSIASANESGRVAVQEQEWARELAEAINNPVAFFQNKELAAKTMNAIETSLRNGRQQVLTQLGYEKNDYVMRTPNTGTKNDPFVIPSDSDQQRIMFTFLQSTIGRTQDPRALVHLRMPNGTVQQVSPTQLRALNQ
jgi:hypothetical protein